MKFLSLVALLCIIYACQAVMMMCSSHSDCKGQTCRIDQYMFGGACHKSLKNVDVGHKCWADFECKLKKCHMNRQKWKGGECVDPKAKKPKKKEVKKSKYVVCSVSRSCQDKTTKCQLNSMIWGDCKPLLKNVKEGGQCWADKECESKNCGANPRKYYDNSSKCKPPKKKELKRKAGMQLCDQHSDCTNKEYPICHISKEVTFDGSCFAAAKNIKNGEKCWADVECQSKHCHMNLHRWLGGECVHHKIDFDNLSLFEESQNDNTVFSTNLALIFVFLISFGCYAFFTYQKRENRQAKMENMRYEMQAQHLVN